MLENTIEDLYQSTGVSFQESYLFDRTIKENIAYFSEEFDENRLNLISKSLGLNEIIEERGLDFYVGSNGKNLSGGERRRASLARDCMLKINLYTYSTNLLLNWMMKAENSLLSY